MLPETMRPLPDGEELVLADDNSPMNPAELPEPDPRSSSLKRRREALNAPGVPGPLRRLADGAGL